MCSAEKKLEEVKKILVERKARWERKTKKMYKEHDYRPDYLHDAEETFKELEKLLE
jgi:hypothetical protein